MQNIKDRTIKASYRPSEWGVKSLEQANNWIKQELMLGS